MVEKSKKVFLNKLPRFGNGDRIDWIKSANQKSKVKFLYNGIEGDVVIEDYTPIGQLLTISYKGNVVNICQGNFVKCKIGKLLKVVTIDFKVDIGTIFNNHERNIEIIDREYRIRNRKNGRNENQKWYKYKCNKCGWDDGWIEESKLITGRKCSCCDGKTVVEGINDIPTTAPWMVKYFQGGYDEAKLYTINTDKKIHPICPDCGNIKNKLKQIKDIYRTNAIGCDCGGGVSYPNKMIHYILKQMNDIYKFESLIFEYYPKWINRRLYDAYFKYNGREYIVEMDGALGHGYYSWKGSANNLDDSLKIDEYKDKKAKENGMKVIRIDCRYRDMANRFDYIKFNVLNSELSEIFNFSYIEWDECEKYCCNNLCKETCYLRKEYNLTYLEIAKKLSISEMTVSRYVKTGVKLGWC